MTRGRLRIYLGAAPGVGKTFAMLAEGARRAARGADVLVGVVDTHGRPGTTDALRGLPTLTPRGSSDGVSPDELDLAAVLARRPSVLLVDDLAHTNAPGGVHAKRWQDVDALLDAGVDVITTVNIQQLESLADVVESIIGRPEPNTVPDAFVRRADQLELIDMAPEALRSRIAHGNVSGDEALDPDFFRVGNLAALRELALIWLADRVDEGLARYRADHSIGSTWATRERLVVALSGVRRGKPCCAAEPASPLDLQDLRVQLEPGLAAILQNAGALALVQNLEILRQSHQARPLADDVVGQPVQRAHPVAQLCDQAALLQNSVDARGYVVDRRVDQRHDQDFLVVLDDLCHQTRGQHGQRRRLAAAGHCGYAHSPAGITEDLFLCGSQLDHGRPSRLLACPGVPRRGPLHAPQQAVERLQQRGRLLRSPAR